jgi:hypothetical protein
LFSFWKLGEIEIGFGDGFFIELVVIVTSDWDLIERLRGFGQGRILIIDFGGTGRFADILVGLKLLITYHRFFGCFLDNILFGRGFKSIAFFRVLTHSELFVPASNGDIVITIRIDDLRLEKITLVVDDGLGLCVAVRLVVGWFGIWRWAWGDYLFLLIGFHQNSYF